MFESELSCLFTNEEIERFHEFRDKLSWIKYPNGDALESYFYASSILEFITVYFQDKEMRREEILSICINEFPQILGLVKENV